MHGSRQGEVAPAPRLGRGLLATGAAAALGWALLGSPAHAGERPSRLVVSGVRTAGAPARVAPELAAALSDRARASVGPLVRFDGADRVQVYVRARGGASDDLANALAGLGARIERISPRSGLIQARVPAARLAELASLAVVESVAPPRYATPRIGSVTTAGDAIVKADALRRLGFNGRDARVGVISDGANARAASVASGDLPGDVTVLSECDPEVARSTCNEGTAILEIVHDLAPAAELGFCGGLTTLDFIGCVDDLRTRFAADVIVDDLGFFGEPYFEDGPVAAAVKDAVDAGVVYVSSAGNEALEHYEADFAGVIDHFEDDAGNPLPEHDFGAAAGQPSDTTLDIVVPVGGTISAFLEWNDPFGGSANDYDLMLLGSDESRVLISSTNAQTGRSDPFEAIAFSNPFARNVTVKLAVVKRSGEARRIELFLSGDVASHQWNVADGSVFGHPAVDGVLAVGAIAASDPGNDDIEAFSSRGPSRIDFPSLESRPKPDIVGIDGVLVTGAGGFPSPFYGTSASAPHVAGVAALLIGGVNTASEVRGALRATGVDLGDQGFDASYGFGRVDGLAAATRLNVAPNASIESPSADVSVTVGESLAFAGSCNDPEGLAPSSFQWSFGGAGPADSTVADPGELAFEQVGTFTVTLRCTDALGAADPTPATRVVTVSQPATHGGGGGGCDVASAGEGEGAASRAAESALGAALGALVIVARRGRRRAAAREPARPASG